MLEENLLEAAPFTDLLLYCSRQSFSLKPVILHTRRGSRGAGEVRYGDSGTIQTGLSWSSKASQIFPALSSNVVHFDVILLELSLRNFAAQPGASIVFATSSPQALDLLLGRGRSIDRF